MKRIFLIFILLLMILCGVFSIIESLKGNFTKATYMSVLFLINYYTLIETIREKNNE